MCFHVSDRVESTLVWPRDGNVFALFPHKKKKAVMTFYKMDLKYATRCPFDENHGQEYCQGDVRGDTRRGWGAEARPPGCYSSSPAGMWQQNMSNMFLV